MKPTVLYFDDDQDGAGINVEYLVAIGFVVNHINTRGMSPREAARLVDGQKPDAVLSDIMWDPSSKMILHGIELGRLLNKRYPLVLISTDGDLASRAGQYGRFSDRGLVAISTALQEVLNGE